MNLAWFTVGWVGGVAAAYLALALVPGEEPTPVPFFTGMVLSLAGGVLVERASHRISA
jgi:hypothetical protein